MQIERKQRRRRRVCPWRKDTKTPTSMEQDDEVKQARPETEPKEPKPEDKGKPCTSLSRKRQKNRSLRTRVSSVPDTRKILFQNVTSFDHNARTWLLSDQMDYDIIWM